MNTFRIVASIALVCCLMVSNFKAQTQLQPLTKENILSGLVKQQIAVFSKTDLFSHALQAQDWYRYLNEIKKFVSENSRGDQKLLCSLDTILEYNDTLITSIKVAYNGLFANDIKFGQATAASALQKFQQVMKAMVEEQKTIVKEAYLYKSKNNVREVLEQLALFTELNAQQASNDLRKRITKAKN